MYDAERAADALVWIALQLQPRMQAKVIAGTRASLLAFDSFAYVIQGIGGIDLLHLNIYSVASDAT